MTTLQTIQAALVAELNAELPDYYAESDFDRIFIHHQAEPSKLPSHWLILLVCRSEHLTVHVNNSAIHFRADWVDPTGIPRTIAFIKQSLAQI